MRGVAKAAAALLLLAAAVAAPAAAAETAVVVEGTQAQAGRPTRAVTTAGEIVPVRSVMIRSEVAGVVASIAFKDGDQVAAGDLLVSLASRRYETLVAEHTASYRLAQQTYERARKIDQAGFGRRADIDTALGNMQEAAALLERARIDLAQTKIRAPFAGRLGIRRVHVGQNLPAMADIVNLADVSSVLVHFRLPQRYLGQVAVGQAFTITASQTGDRRFEAKISAIDPQLAADSRTLRIQGTVANARDLLRPGQFVTVAMELSAGPPQVFVPEAAIVYNGGSRFVVKVVDGRSRPVKVETGTRFDGMVAVTGDVADADTVIVAGQEKVFRGNIPVKVLPPSFFGPAKERARIVPDGAAR